MNQYIKYTLFIIIFTFLSACGGPGENTLDESKKDFFVTTQKLSDFGSQTFLTKTSRISSASDITLTSNASGRVQNVFVREGDSISIGQPLFQLEDNIANYYLTLKQAENELERAKINYDSQKITLDKQVSDASLALKRAQIDLDNIQIQASQDILQAQNTRNDSDTTSSESTSSLELKRLEDNIAKSELDYGNTLVSDEQTIEGFKTTLTKDMNAQLIFLDDIIEFADTLLGITDKNDNFADDIDQFLGARDTNQKQDTSTLLRELITFREGDFQTTYNSPISTEEDIYGVLAILREGYDISKILLNELEETLNNSLSSAGDFSDSDIAGYITTGNGYQTSLQANYTAFVAYENSVDTFLKTYLTAQASLAKGIELLKQDKEILLRNIATGDLNSDAGLEKTLSASQSNIDNLSIALETAQNNLNNAEKTRNVTLRSLQNGINTAQIGYNLALTNYKKLTITSPIDGVMGNILVEIGQDVNNGGGVAQISGQKQNELEISFTRDELPFITLGNEVFLSHNGQTSTGTIFSLSNVADQNLNYASKILFDENIGVSGDVVELQVPIQAPYTLLPLDIVTVLSDSKGSIYVVQSGSIISQDIELGNIYSQFVEFRDVNILENLDIVTSNVSNFDPNKFELSIKEFLKN
ncbi:biotin/lipoyl-binding protein [Candidatus Gracilibacteria bacterium]|nr:biotin/lipoyl-binding protein [Candidatus Gracilibacteria bacterium]